MTDNLFKIVTEKTLEMKIHFATPDDIESLAVHHRKMFEEIWERKGQVLEMAKAIEVEKAYLRKLDNEIPTGICKAWVVKNDGEIVASGAISIISYVPIPDDTNNIVAYLHSIYTEKDFRGRKLARQIIEQAIDYCKENGIHRVILSASNAGRPLYEKLGFVATPETMRMFIR
jgi:GNAT superfamily N-acetyltransferase